MGVACKNQSLSKTQSASRAGSFCTRYVHPEGDPVSFKMNEKDKIMDALNARIAELIATVNSLTTRLEEQSKTIQALTATIDAKRIIDEDGFSSNESVASSASSQVKRRKTLKTGPKTQPTKVFYSNNRYDALDKDAEHNKQVTAEDSEMVSDGDDTVTEETKSTREQRRKKKPMRRIEDVDTESRPTEHISEAQQKIPPVFIQQKEKWDEIAETFERKNVNFTHVKNTDSGIKVQLSDIESHRTATKLLRESKYSFYTYSTKEEAMLRVVIKGLPEYYSSDEIKEDLNCKVSTQKGFIG